MRTLLIALVALAAIGCAEKKPTSATVEKRDIVGYLSLNAELVAPPTARADIFPPYSAPVEKVMTTVGDNVKAGQVLVQLSFPDVDAAVAQARANVQAAQTAQSAAKGTYEASLKTYREAVASAVAEERRMQALVNEGAADASELASASQARAAAEAALQEQQSQVQVQILPYTQQLRDAQDDLKLAQSGAKQASIRAPISGTVLALNVASGQMIGEDAKKVIITIVDLEAMEVQATVPPEQANEVKEDTDVVIKFKEIPTEDIEGKVRRLVTLPAKAGGAVAYKALIDFPNKEGLVKPGMALTLVGVKMGEVKDVIAVPVEAVDKDSTGKPIVKVLKGSEWLPTVVEVGLTDGKYIEVKSGLKVGDTVQVTPD